jgi:hypothetical protein
MFISKQNSYTSNNRNKIERSNSYHTDRIKLNKYIEDRNLHKYDGIQITTDSNTTIQNLKTNKEITIQHQNVKSQFPLYTLHSGLNTCVINTQLVEIPEIISLSEDTVLTQYHIYIGRLLITDNCTFVQCLLQFDDYIVIEIINTTDNCIKFTTDTRCVNIPANSTKFITLQGLYTPDGLSRYAL